MKKIGIISILAFAFSLFLSGAVLAGGMKEGKRAAATAGEFVGMAVIDQQGESIGEISAFQADEAGTIRFLVLAVGEKEHRVPFGAFKSGETTETLILTVDENLLANAPAKAPGMTEEEYSRELYEHYGQAPYWGPGAPEK